MQKLIAQSKKILIVSHYYPDPDAIMSLYIMYEFVKQVNPMVSVSLANEGPVDEYLVDLVKYAYTDNNNEIFNNKIHIIPDIVQTTLHSQITQDVDLIIFLDNNKLQNFSKNVNELVNLLKQYNDIKVAVIDHHPKNLDFGVHIDHYIHQLAASTTEILGNLFFEEKLASAPAIARLIAIGIIGDTNRFLYSNNITNKTFNLLSRSIRIASLDFFHIYKKILNLDIKGAQLLGYFFRLLKQHQYDCKKYRSKQYKDIKKVVVSSLFLNQRNIKRLHQDGYSYSQIEHAFYFFINTYLLLIEGTDVGVAGFYDIKDKKWYLSLRSTDLDVRRIAISFGGGGHPQAAGFIINGELSQGKILGQIIKNF